MTSSRYPGMPLPDFADEAEVAAMIPPETAGGRALAFVYDTNPMLLSRRDRVLFPLGFHETEEIMIGGRRAVVEVESEQKSD